MEVSSDSSLREFVAMSEQEKRFDEAAATPNKISDVTTLEQLLNFAYARPGKRFVITPAVMKVIRTDRHTEPDIPDPLAEQIKLLAREDPLLAAPRRLLGALEAADPPTLLRTRIVKLVSIVLAGHPMFSAAAVRAVIAGAHADSDNAFVALANASIDITPQELGLGIKGLQPADRRKLRLNAIAALGHVLVAQERIDLLTLSSLLDRYVWRKELQAAAGRKEELVLLESDDPAALAVVTQQYLARCEESEETAVKESIRAEFLVKRNEELQMEIERLSNEIDVKEHAASELASQISNINSQVENERHERLVDGSHHIDRYSQLRARFTSLLRAQIVELDKGLAALRKGHADVIEEYVERCIEKMSAELEQLSEREEPL